MCISSQRAVIVVKMCIQCNWCKVQRTKHNEWISLMTIIRGWFIESMQAKALHTAYSVSLYSRYTCAFEGMLVSMYQDGVKCFRIASKMFHLMDAKDGPHTPQPKIHQSHFCLESFVQSWNLIGWVLLLLLHFDIWSI